MLGFAILGVLGIGLLFTLGGDDDDDSDRDSTREQGTEGDDYFDVGDGDDTVYAAAGADVINAGSGEDRVFGGDDDDLIVGGAGDDFLRGGADDDAIFGSAGADVLNGDVGDDVLFGADIFDAEGFINFLRDAGDSSDDVDERDLLQFLDLDGDPLEADTLNGGVGDDLILAGSNDVVDTGTGSDELNVGDWVVPGQPVNVVDFDPSKDDILYSYFGDTEPLVFFGETDRGVATLEADGTIVAVFPGVDFFDLVGGSSITLERIG